VAIILKRETEQRLLGSIKRYLSEQLGEEAGDLKAKLFLDFCLREIGPSIYNQAIADAQGHIQNKLVDLDGECSLPEFAYWKSKKRSD